MASMDVSEANMESDLDNQLTDGAEGTDVEKPAEQIEKPKIKRQRSRRPSKKKERTFDWPKKSLYEAIYVDSNGGEKNLIHRVFVLSKIEEGVSNRTEVGNRFDSFLKRMKSDYQTEPITGLMLIYMKHIVHVMECSADMISELARELVSLEESEESLLAKSKILVISHDIPQRQYQGWCFRTLDIVEPGLEAYEANDTAENLTVDLLSQLLRLGSFLAKQPKLNLKSAIDSLHDKVPELLPQQSIVHFLLEDNDPCIMTPQEYVNIHDRPFDVTLDSDLVWPLPTRLFPYN